MSPDQRPDPQAGKSLARMGIAALGVVFGDIGTSPLYTLKTVLDVTGGVEPAACARRALAAHLDADHRHFDQICLLRHARR